MMKDFFKVMKIVVFLIIILVSLYFLSYIISIPAVFMPTIRFLTLYILPWIFLYWFIRLVKSMESK